MYHGSLEKGQRARRNRRFGSVLNIGLQGEGGGERWEGRDQPVPDWGHARDPWGWEERMRFFTGQATEARLPFPVSPAGSFSLFLFLTIGVAFLYLFPSSASYSNSQKSVGGSVSQEKK